MHWKGSAKRLIKAALQEAARKREMRYSDLKKIERGVRRHFHDDITVIVVFLDHDLISKGSRRSLLQSVRGGGVSWLYLAGQVFSFFILITKSFVIPHYQHDRTFRLPLDGANPGCKSWVLPKCKLKLASCLTNDAHKNIPVLNTALKKFTNLFGHRDLYFCQQ